MRLRKRCTPGKWLLAGLLVLVSISLSFGYIRSTTEDGHPEYWPQKRATLNLRLGCPAGRPCWDDAARSAAEEWNAAGSPFRFRFLTPSRSARQSCTQVDRINTVLWSANDCGIRIGEDALALAVNWTAGDGRIVDSDVVFNTALEWDVYDGPLRSNADNTDWLVDLRRVALHEFGHVLGLDHPDEHGQTVVSVMSTYDEALDLDRLHPDDIAGIQAIYGVEATDGGTPPKGLLENPGHETFASGVGVISGWVCEAQRVEVQIGTQRLRMAYGTERLDTQGECGDTNNGFVTLVNYNRLGDGVHTARLVVDGQLLGRPAEFLVTTFGTEFLREAEGDYILSDFPVVGIDTRISWSEGRQNFVIEEWPAVE